MYLCSNKKKEYAEKYKRMDTIRLGSGRVDFRNSAGIYQLFHVEDARCDRQRALVLRTITHVRWQHLRCRHRHRCQV